MSKNLLYFVKNPVPGKVKTRLAKKIGEKKACEIYRKLAKHNFELLLSTLNNIVITVLFDPPDAENCIRDWLPQPQNASLKVLYYPQADGDLTQRLKKGFQWAFEQGAEQVAALGSDTLALNSELIQNGFEALNEKDFVIGPALDGGYYLIGSSQDRPDIFENIDWSTELVCEQTIQNIQKASLSYAKVGALEDLDEQELNEIPDYLLH